MTTSRYTWTRVPLGHPLAGNGNAATSKNGTPVRTHRVVLYEKIGPGPHPCHWCGKELNWTTNQRVEGTRQLCGDHLNGDTSDNRPENIVPACHGCNAHRERRVPDDELFIERQGKRIRAVERFCNTCGTQFLATFDVVARGNGRYCSRECMYDRNR